MTGDHPTETHRRREEARRAELLATLDRLNIALLDRGATPALLAVDLEDAPLHRIQSVIEQTRHRLQVLGEQ